MEATKQVREPQKKGPVGAEIQLIVFRIGEELFGIRIEQVKEVTYTPPISKMPKAPPYILGVTNIRGDIIPVMDLEARLDIGKGLSLTTYTQPGKYVVVVDTVKQLVGIPVKEVPYSVSIPANAIDKARDLVEQSQIAEGFIQGIARSGEKLVVVIDIENIINREFQ